MVSDNPRTHNSGALIGAARDTINSIHRNQRGLAQQIEASRETIAASCELLRRADELLADAPWARQLRENKTK
ncbi:MAG TPA: hypothetical protein VKP67_04830 [Xanthobacteraceae bacterium]|nr:hypothetical protein [Xanthobacteraceae bacterium]